MIKFSIGTGVGDCTYQEGETFYLGTMRANYLCPAEAWKDQVGRLDLEHWIVGSPFKVANNQRQVLMISLLPRATYTPGDQNICGEQPICIIQVQNYALLLPQ